MVKELDEFYEDRKRNINSLGVDKELITKSNDFMQHSGRYNYTYNFDWLGRPIIQFPQDIIVLQELFLK